MEHPYNSFSSFVKRRFGQPVQKVNIDAGFTCPNRDGKVGTGGCTYCNNNSFKPGHCRPALTVREQVQNGITYTSRRYGAEKFLAYFQAYTNTYAPVDRLRELYAEALSVPGVIGLAIGTRPDCVDSQKLDLLEELSQKHFILVEYGIQSVHDKTLRAINRGHDFSTFKRAVAETNKRGIETGAHMIVGFPSETRQETLDGAHEITATGVGFVKVHQLQIIKDTPMAGQYEKDPFPVLEYGEYLWLVGEFLDRLGPDIVIQRLFATAPEDIL
ncbi:MAG: TIGR01212 family radical SAM protein, partial [Thermodesulfovibrionales bacterium]|nr:TIGR01212 family radical SAM protein [Thermodesulfovibrionales bacterium]